MKKVICIILATLGLWSCISPSSKNLVQPTLAPLQTIFIKDSSQYDHSFITGLSDYKEPIQLIENYIITGADTIYFPEDLPLNNTIAFKATKDQQKYLLTVTRTNLTNLAYSFKLTDEKDKLIGSKSGNAILGYVFFLGSETDVDTETGEVYGSYEYWDKNNDCWFALRIGQGNDQKGKHRAMIKYGCEDKNKQTISLDNLPTLRTE